MPDRTLVGCRILIVEDEYLLASDLSDELEAAGALVIGPAADVAEAQALLAREHHLDGAILDINLGGETSYALAEELRRREIPFLFTTGYDAHAIPEHYKAVVRCEKPVQVAVVRRALGRLIGR